MSGDRSTLIPVEPFRERFVELREAGRLNEREVAARLGYRHRGGTGSVGWDGRRVERVLGLKPIYGRRHRVAKYVEHETAVNLCRALDLDYQDVGL